MTESYPDDNLTTRDRCSGRGRPSEIASLYDLGETGVAERLRREFEGWRGYADIEIVEGDTALLTVFPGGALRVRR